MSITIDWATKVISIPQSYLTLIAGNRYSLDLNLLRTDLNAISAGETGIAFPAPHRRNVPVTLSGVVYAPTLEIINGYSVRFENTGTPYSVRCLGANHNLEDVTIMDGGVSLIVGNSAGLQIVATGSAVLPSDVTAIADAVMGYTSPDGLTFAQQQKILVSVLSGRLTIDTDGTIRFKNVAGTADVVVMTANPQGERLSVTLNV